jgi:hypothetical protein
MSELAVIGEQERPEVFTSSRPTDDPAPTCRWRQSLEDGRPALGIIASGHLADGLVIQQHFNRILLTAEVERFPIEADPVRAFGTIAERRDPIIDGHATSTNPVFDSAPRSVARARQQFLQSFCHGGGSITNCYMAIPSPASSLFGVPA